MSDAAETMTAYDLPVKVFETAELASRAAAGKIAEQIRARPAPGRCATLGLATGRTPLRVYEELVRNHRAGLSFANVVTFNLDEYHPIASTHPGSFRSFMKRHLFDQVDLRGDRCHLPDGSLGEAEVEACCRAYEAEIADCGGIDLQLLGLGRNGHIGFNEPGSRRDSRTRRVRLHPTTLADNARAFEDGKVPDGALTMGIGTILEARSILLLVLGARKARTLERMLGGPISRDLPASFLREHEHVEVLADRAAAAALS